MTTIKLTLLSALLIISACNQQDDPGQTATIGEAPQPIQAPVEQAAPDGPIREITNITGDLYRARNNNHYTVFLVTPEGTILGDPINVGFAEWLKTELADRFESTVRYVLYSHHHWDHASGGAVFEDTAEFVGHNNMILALDAGLPGNQRPNDANGDGMLQREEATGGTLAQFDVIDADDDGNLTGLEFNANIRKPTFGYSDRNLIMLGGKQVQMVHPGPNHSDDASILLFPDERAAFAVDFINIRRLPGGFSGVPIEQWGNAINMMARMDIDTVIPGHGEAGTPDDLADYWQYFQDLNEAVAAGIANGKTAEELQQSITLDNYKDWGRYETQLPINIAGAYELLRASAQ